MTTTKNNSRRFFAMISLISSALVCFYIFQVVKLTEAGYIQGEKQSQITELKKEVGQLKLSVSEDSNLVSIEQKVAEAGFEKITSPNYIIVSEASVASK